MLGAVAVLSVLLVVVAVVPAEHASACGAAGEMFWVEVGPLGVWYWAQCDVAVYEGCGDCLRVASTGPIPFDERVQVLP